MKKLIFLFLALPMIAFGQNTNPKDTLLSPDQLKKYPGEYRLNDQFKIDVTLEDNKLYALAQDDAEKMELTAQSETKFTVKGTPAEVEFIFEGENITYMLVKMEQEQKLKKIR